MRPCIVGIGGAAGNILRHFLESQDAYLPKYSLGEHLAFGSIKGLWLDSASHDIQDQSFYGDLADDRYPGYLVCHGGIDDSSKTREYVMDRYGYDLKKQGYDRRAEYLKGIFEIFRFDKDLQSIASEEFKGDKNPLAGYIWLEGIRPFTTISLKPSEQKENGNHSPKLCDSILFIASLGGGTGTGFINPITSSVRSDELTFPIFTLGILTEKGIDRKKTEEGQRDLGAVIAMYDLLTKKAGTGIDGLILIDNQILIKRFGDNYQIIDSAIYSAMKPLLDLRNYPGAEHQDEVLGIQRVFWETDDDRSSTGIECKEIFLPILVPCYYSHKGATEESLVDNALSKGRLFNCDPTKAERAFIFTRGFLSSSKIIDAVHEKTRLSADKIKVYRKMGVGNSKDILILLRNPYGGSPGDHGREDTFENRIYGIVDESIKYIDKNESNILGYHGYKEVTKNYLKDYFYGANGLKHELEIALQRLSEGRKPFFTRPLRIFDGVCEAVHEGKRYGPESQTQITDKVNIEELVREELKKILGSEEYRDKIREVRK